ncbi:type IV secretion system DNA-binding domain-containing protein [Candidatus Saccharibacteria bacterium]|nr:type IV secretion system DNA-binding domain-containing protein [Candidatus Saccharibacteria bacterium]
MNLVEWLFQLIMQWYVWLPLLGVLAFLTWQNYRRARVIDTYSYVLLELELPRGNDQTESAAEQLFASLHGILRDRQELKMSGGVQEHLSFEIAGAGEQLRFFVRVPQHLQGFVESQIHAQYPAVQIIETPDYVAGSSNYPATATVELVLADNELLPIKTFPAHETDPLAGVMAALSQHDSGEVWLQILARPINDDWHTRAARWVAQLKSGYGARTSSGAWVWFAQVIEALWKPPESGLGSTTTREMNERDKLRVAEIDKKASKPGYQVKIRLASLGRDSSSARSPISAIANAFKQFNDGRLNGFRLHGKPSTNREDLQKYAARFFTGDGFILNTEELASIFHLPYVGSATSKAAQTEIKEVTDASSSKLPLLTGERDHDDQISAFGLANIDGVQQQFGMYRSDRSRHVYIIGQTGVGKSALLELFALSDIFHGEGYAIIDPHGDFAVDNLRFIPPNRIDDVVYFNPADTAHPLGFNPMEVYDPSQRNNVSSEIIGVLKRMFGDSWGPRLEYILRYTLLALLEYPDTTLLDITRMLTDKKFREKVLEQVTDTVVLQFWRVEFTSWNDRFVAEAVAPVLNKVGAFVANPIIRNIVGQPKSTFNIREIMDQGKILIVNLNKGLIGDDNATILGALMVTKIQLAAMSRSDIPNIDDRRPFYLYVDEFQNFATDSFAVILSEARKYGLNLTVANQYVSQMSESVRNAVFGNVGTIISMRVSAEDAPLLATQFAPRFEANDVLQMSNRDFVCSMIIQGEKTPAFFGTTLKLPPAQTDHLSQIVEHTRNNYTRDRAAVEAEITAAIMPPANLRSKTATPTMTPPPVNPNPPQKVVVPDPIPDHVKAANISALIASAQAAAAASPQQIEELSPKKVTPPAPEPAPITQPPVAPVSKPKRRRVRGRRKSATAQTTISDLPTEPNLPPPPAATDPNERVFNLR